MEDCIFGCLMDHLEGKVDVLRTLSLSSAEALVDRLKFTTALWVSLLPQFLGIHLAYHEELEGASPTL